MQLILTVLHLALAIGLVGLILIQHGRGADAGAAFGSGASGTVFGAQGSGSFLTRTTAILATLFFLTSMALAYFAAQVGEPQGLMDGAELPPPPAPAVIDSGDVPMPDLPAGAFDAGAEDVPAPPAVQGAPDASPQGVTETLDMSAPDQEMQPQEMQPQEMQPQDAPPVADSGIGVEATPTAGDSDMPATTD